MAACYPQLKDNLRLVIDILHVLLPVDRIQIVETMTLGSDKFKLRVIDNV